LGFLGPICNGAQNYVRWKRYALLHFRFADSLESTGKSTLIAAIKEKFTAKKSIFSGKSSPTAEIIPTQGIDRGSFKMDSSLFNYW
jgi:hypothetical protein